ncbi:unnamed protein product, partial [Polarella glacialis]
AGGRSAAGAGPARALRRRAGAAYGGCGLRGLRDLGGVAPRAGQRGDGALARRGTDARTRRPGRQSLHRTAARLRDRGRRGGREQSGCSAAAALPLCRLHGFRPGSWQRGRRERCSPGGLQAGCALGGRWPGPS